MKNIPQNRAVLYLIIVCLVPCLLVGLLFYSDLNRLNDIERQMEEVRDAAVLKDKRQALNQTVKAHFKDADHFYIDKNLETLSFLDPEMDAMQKIAQQKNFPEDESVKKRLEFLTGSQNDIVFSEGVVQSYGTFQETTETLVHPIEVNIDDLHKILSRIEGVAIGGEVTLPHRPQLIILDFKLDKKKSYDKMEVFLLNMKLLKREFL